MSAKRELRDSISGPSWLRGIVSLQEGAEERDQGREEAASKEGSQGVTGLLQKARERRQKRSRAEVGRVLVTRFQTEETWQRKMS